ncbi:radical SAM protein [uncultured Rhodoblastus sp.]|uniref:B12-binding domain-containing radical SAM protein n=1 Tax=uncultured Rhodoblastus sp. TaxID=543037 RepID=UPI0025E3D68E|nr:radical SAM protein [uncultured Rhodoblastus sp.]
MATETFKLYLIKPSHYDDEGYVIQWLRSAIPSNTLAALHGLAADCAARKVLGPHVQIEIIGLDETNTRIRPEKIAAAIEAAGRGLVCLVGVQSNQFPHALDLARRFRACGADVAMGGFHVSGCIAMLPELPADLIEAQELGISLFAGEAEGRLETVLRDAYAGKLQKLYNFMKDLPGIENTPAPLLPSDVIKRTSGAVTSFDAGRGCPFQCSFCTIINVQGRKSRYRSADDVEAIVRANLAQGISSFFITDDNIARNKNWEPIFDRLIAMRESGVRMSFVVQVDTLSHRIPRFIDKASKAGVRRVFIGLENINPENLIAAKKKQNRISEYREMLLAWKMAGCYTTAGYITGFPADTQESILRDIEIIKRELPLDMLEFFFLTPLPGSEDHQRLHKAGVWMDPDMNKYDLEHAVTAHPKMSKEEWEGAYRKAWAAYYTPEHMETVMKRAAATGNSPGKAMFLLLWFWAGIHLEHIHPLEGGYLRRKVRRDRRPGMKLENPLTFYPRIAVELVVKHVRLAAMAWRLARLRRQLKKSPIARTYMDEALTPVVDSDLDNLEMFNNSAASRAAGDHAKKMLAKQHEKVA